MIIDHVEPIEFDADFVEGHKNELNSVNYLAIGLEYLCRQTQKIEDMVSHRLIADSHSVLMGNAPELADIPQPLIACFFHWYAVSACNYIRMVGWLWHQMNPVAPSPSDYLKNVSPELKVWRDKVAAHLAKADTRNLDNPAEKESSVLWQIALIDGKFIAQPYILTISNDGKTSDSSKLVPWSLTDVHNRLAERYWTERTS